MNAEEKAIIEFLRGYGPTFVTAKEISRKVGGRKRCEKEPGWALPILAKMTREGTIEADALGHFRLVKQTDKKKRFGKFVSPQLLRILKSSGRTFEAIVIDEDEEPTEEEKEKEKEGEKPSEDEKL
ncbi:MAG TPA: hypothetical protein VH413_09760 [Verrucomicrobiae bacterium]|jgi:hypothetical protein|nr:hypothetical protein [Verrucomicrobiae bacterium]